jgi:hypothetical protein
MEERHIVDVLSDLRKERRDEFAALATRGEVEWRLHERPDLLGEKTSILVEAGQRLIVTFLQFGLKSHVSTWLGPPFMKSQMTAFAFASGK